MSSKHLLIVPTLLNGWIWDNLRSKRGKGYWNIRINLSQPAGNVFQSAKADWKIATRPALVRSPAQRFRVACRTQRGFSSSP